MGGFIARLFGCSSCLLALLVAPSTYADPFFVRVYGRTYKVDPRYTSEEPKGPKPQEAMRALPPDIAKGPGFKPSHEQVLAEVEERLWIARNQLDGEVDETAASREWRNAAVDANGARQAISEALATGSVQSRTPDLQKLYDRHRAMNLLARELRQSLDLPQRGTAAGFSRPKLPPEIELSYRDLNFDPIEAYYGFRRVKAAFRSGDIELVARVAHLPLTITGKTRRTVRDRDQLIAAKSTIMAPGIRDVVAKSTFESVFVRDKGMMLGAGEVWITRNGSSFGLGAVNLE